MALPFHHSISTVDPEIQKRAAAFATQLAELVREAALDVVKTTLQHPASSATRRSPPGPTGRQPKAKTNRKRTATGRKTSSRKATTRATKNAPKKRRASPVAKRATPKKKTPATKTAVSKATPKGRRTTANATMPKRIRITKKVAAAKVPPARRKPRGLDASVVAKALREDITQSPGRSVETIADSLGVSPRDLKTPLKTLLRAGTIRAGGSKRSPRYFPA